MEIIMHQMIAYVLLPQSSAVIQKIQAVGEAAHVQ